MQGKIALNIRTKYPLIAGDILLIEQPNTHAFVEGVLGAKKWYKKYPKLRSEIVKVASFAKDELVLSFRSNTPLDKHSSITAIDTVHNVHLKDIVLDSMDKSSPYNHVYKNSRKDLMIDGIKFFYASNSTIEHITIRNSGSSPLVFERCYDCRARDITIDGAINKGKKGNGYLRINKSFHLSLEDISVSNIRHIVFQWSSAYNRIDKLNSSVDVNFHGGATHDNLVSNAVFHVDSKKHKWGKVFITPDNARWAPPDFKSNSVEEKQK